ncbi:formylglycine-generating enzyme family protein [Nocardia sp. NPDC059764]|uniref:formylglycine-generating enzyme family protein n=1 Tax=Nocardia sp. NPDC059764 TaxID=3346939 RepID=UPI00366756CC
MRSSLPDASPKRPKGMARVPGGSFVMGSEDFFPEEQPVHTVTVEPFWIDEHPVTNAEFRRFVKATGYVTVAERPLDPADFPGADLADLVPGGLVFQRTAGPVRLDDYRQWWAYVPGASWRHPRGPASTLDGLDRHPVTQIAHEDATAYATWAGRSLPTEIEWEFAARGGLDAATYAWGDEFEPRGRRMANTWAGRFPWEFLPARGQSEQPGTTAIGTYPPNGYGLSDMTGNVWEWTSDLFTADRRRPAPASCCAPANPVVAESYTAERFPRRVTKGGSFLCAPNYCLRYRPAARQGQTEDTATCHLGFRTVMRESANGGRSR